MAQITSGFRSVLSHPTVYDFVQNVLVVKIKRTSPEHPQQFQGVLRLAEGSKRVILSTRCAKGPKRARSKVCPPL
jgi:hypothetical protein